MNGNGHSKVWAWLAAFLAGVVLAGGPAAFATLSSPSRADYQDLQEELTLGQIQSARIEERIVQLSTQVQELKEILNERS